MAIYRNREVTVNELPAIAPISTVSIVHKDGMQERVGVGEVKFTKEEKDRLSKTFPNPYDNLQVASDDDMKSVKLGVAPGNDPQYQEQAKSQVTNDEAQKLHQKHMDAAKKDAQKEMDNSAPTKVSK